MLLGRVGQTLNEYAIVIAIIAMAIMGINLYLKRGIQNAIVLTADDLGSSATDIYKIQSQSLGGMESGLIEYTGNTNIAAEKTTTLVTVPLGARTYTTVKDDSLSTGSWSTIYKLGDTESFGAKEKNKKPSGEIIKK